MATSEIVSPNALQDNSPLFSPNPTDATNNVIDGGAFLAQVEKILKSKELHSSEVLRRLLRFLAEKFVSDSSEDLKEYSVAIEALGKPTSYDPRHSSAVRILVGRLRQKLANYYQLEGQNDPILIDLPKGQFKLTCELREGSVKTARQSSHAIESPEMAASKPFVTTGFSEVSRSLRAAVWVALGIIVAVAGETVFHHIQASKAKAVGVSSSAPNMNSSLEQLWGPFITNKRPVIVVVGAPLFAVLDVNKRIVYRDKNFNDPDSFRTSLEMNAVRTAVKSNQVEPVRYYTAFGESKASFMIASLLGSHVNNLSEVRTSDLSMQDVADNNIVFIGNQSLYFNQQIQASPIEPPLQPGPDGIRNLHPEANEPAMFADQYSEAPTEEGYAYALVTRLPGPLGGNDVESFSSNRAAGYLAAVKAFTDPGSVQPLIDKLKQASNGQMPRYFQILLKVRFKTEVPTEITYVLSRELHYKQKQ